MNTPDSGSVKFLNEERIEHAERLLTQAEKAAGAIPDAKRRGEVARQIAVERNVFEAWHGIYRNFSAKAGLRRIVIPQAQAPGSLEGAVPLPPFKTAKKENAILLHFVKKQSQHSRNPCAVKSQSGIIGRDAPFYSV